MRIAIIHAFFNIVGGGEYLVLNIVEALSKKYSIDIYTTSKPNKDFVKDIFGIDVSRFNFKKIELLTLIDNFPRLVLLKKLLKYHSLSRIIDYIVEDYDFSIETQSNIPLPVDLSYIHYPLLAEIFHDLRGKGLYGILLKRLYKKWFSSVRSGRIVCNSRFTARMIYRYYHVLPDVIHPPVDTEYFKCENNDRDNAIATVSRLIPEKNLDKIPVLSRLVKGYVFRVIGSRAFGSDKVIEKLTGYNNIRVYVNVERTLLKKLLCTSKIYLHPPFREHFGISVVEAMSSGLVPIVYYDSGSCTDIVSKVNPRLCYSDIRDVPKIIKFIEKHYDELQQKSIQVSRMFDKRVFQRKIMEYVEKLIELKKT